MPVADYVERVTSAHRNKPKYIAMLTQTLTPAEHALNLVQSIPAHYDIDTAVGDQLLTIGQWVGAPHAVPDASFLPLFGFDGQENAQNFGEGFWRESGVTGGVAADLDDLRYRQVIRAQIYRNHCNGTIPDAYTILRMVSDAQFCIADNQDMSISVGLQSGTPRLDIQLMRLMFPRPAGVGLRFFSNWIGAFGWADQPDSAGFGDGFWIEEV